MKRYKVVYISASDDDCTSVWTTANDREEAENNIRWEYWDVKEIIDCYEI